MPYYPEQPERQKPAKDRESRKKRYSPWRIAVIGLCLLLILFGMIKLGEYGLNWAASRKTSQELRETLPETPKEAETAAETTELIATVTVPQDKPETPEVTEEPEPAPAPAGNLLAEVPYPDNNPPMIREKFYELRRKSEWAVGWLKVSDLVDEAVVQRDNSFFLNHDAMGNRNSNGAIFLEEEVQLRTRPWGMMLFGHNMKSGTMFGELRKFENAGYCYQHRILTLDTIYEDGTYVIFGVARVHLNPGTANYTDLYAFQSNDRARRATALEQLRKACSYVGAEDVQPEDQILLLVTCVEDDDIRLVVAARRLRDHETENRQDLRKVQARR